MVILTTIYGHLLEVGVTVAMSIPIYTIVLGLIHHALHHCHLLLATLNSVNRQIQIMYSGPTNYALMMNFGMENSTGMKAPVALKSLPHGLLLIFQHQRLMILRCVFFGNEGLENENTPIELLEIYVQ